MGIVTTQNALLPKDASKIPTEKFNSQPNHTSVFLAKNDIPLNLKPKYNSEQTFVKFLKSDIKSPSFIFWLTLYMLCFGILSITTFFYWRIQQLKQKQLVLEKTIESLSLPKEKESNKLLSFTYLESLETTISPEDEKWLEKVEETIYNKMDDSRFNLLFLATELGLSPRQFRRKIKRITGAKASDYQKNIRLLYAQQFIASKKYKTIKEIAQKVGYNDSKYFSMLCRKFHRPSEVGRINR